MSGSWAVPSTGKGVTPTSAHHCHRLEVPEGSPPSPHGPAHPMQGAVLTNRSTHLCWKTECVRVTEVRDSQPLGTVQMPVTERVDKLKRFVPTLGHAQNRGSSYCCPPVHSRLKGCTGTSSTGMRPGLDRGRGDGQGLREAWEDGHTPTQDQAPQPRGGTQEKRGYGHTETCAGVLTANGPREPVPSAAPKGAAHCRRERTQHTGLRATPSGGNWPQRVPAVLRAFRILSLKAELQTTQVRT